MPFCYAQVNEKHAFLSWQTCIYGFSLFSRYLGSFHEKIPSESVRIVTSKCMKWKCQDWKKGYQSPLIFANHLYKLEATGMSKPIVSLSFTICSFLCHYVSLYFCLFYKKLWSTFALCHLQSALWVASPTPTWESVGRTFGQGVALPCTDRTRPVTLLANWAQRAR